MQVDGVEKRRSRNSVISPEDASTARSSALRRISHFDSSCDESDADLSLLPPNHRAGPAHLLLVNEYIELVGNGLYGEQLDLRAARGHVPDKTLNVRRTVVDLDCSEFAGTLATRSAQVSFSYAPRGHEWCPSRKGSVETNTEFVHRPPHYTASLLIIARINRELELVRDTDDTSDP